MTATLDSLRTRLDEHDGGTLPPLTDELVRTLDLDLPDGARLPIAEVSRLTGVSAHTLRYYERTGLVQVGRDSGGRRAYDRHAIGRVVFVSRLRASDMPIRSIQRYMELVEQGDDNIAERLEILLEHRAEIRRRLDDLQWALALVDYKITTYSSDGC